MASSSVRLLHHGKELRFAAVGGKLHIPSLCSLLQLKPPLSFNGVVQPADASGFTYCTFNEDLMEVQGEPGGSRGLQGPPRCSVASPGNAQNHEVHATFGACLCSSRQHCGL